ncbi:MAG: KpsF/GutQ family sugar-phosphate isomerase [Betaproteobacteria bacterium]|nr:KpsF/GutQ family sugar-phosphate isomerase [Betaproteobacteria bacterium]
MTQTPQQESPHLAVARRVLLEELEAIAAMADRLDSRFVAAVDVILACEGRVVVTGVGKSGHVGRKIAATLASTGCPAFFVHSAEAGHGDLGMITGQDVVLAISNSGESDEVVNLVVFAKRFGAYIIGMTGRPASALAQASEIVLDSSVVKEACPLGIAPTSSTTVQLALGDALAMAALSARGFSSDDFARTHPKGALGRRLFMRVRDCMKDIDNVPHMNDATPLLTAISEMATSRAGAIIVLGSDKKLAGIFTDSDLRRLLVRSSQDLGTLQSLCLRDVVTAHPLSINADHLASEAMAMIEARHVSRLICMDGDRVAGLISLHDLIEHKIA